MKKRLLIIFLSFVCFFSMAIAGVKRKQKEIVSSKNIVNSKMVAQGTIVPEFNEEQFYKNRRKDAQELVDKATNYLKKNSIAKSFNAFSYDQNFMKGELYLFVYDFDGVCNAIGKYQEILWKNLYDYQDSYGVFIVRSLIEKAKKGGGWIVYEWKNATKMSYVTQVKKDGKTYAVGCGFYPHSKRDAVINLVDGAASYFNSVIKREGSVEEAFSRFNYSLGQFVLGDLYIFALDFDGNIVAQGDRPGLIGQNSLQYQDVKGTYVNKEIIKKLKKSDGGVWVEYVSKRAPKMAYARKVTDAKGKHYFIACGYYPTAGRTAVVDLVRSGFRYMEMHGISQSKQKFTSKTEKGFRFGDLFVFLYDLNGNVIAHGDNPDYVGTNQSKVVDDTGRYFVQEMIDKAKAGGGWIDYKIRNSSRFVYVELVKIGKNKFVIGSGLHPISKPEMMQLLVKGGVSLLADSSKEEAFGAFVKNGGEFTKGDLSLFVTDFDGICYAWGTNKNIIWRDLSKAKDDKGRNYISSFIKIVKDGSGTSYFSMSGSKKVAYFEKVQKDGTNYLVGSSFYL
ncbi:cache domain-containing protein [bacterium]|nr:cache domain-containing protein [bacterium]